MSVPLELQYHDESIDKWCAFELCGTMAGSIEKIVKITDKSQILDEPYGRYLYDNNTSSNVWFYVTTSKDKIRLRPRKK
jgi:hypothetical protein